MDFPASIGGGNIAVTGAGARRFPDGVNGGEAAERTEEEGEEGGLVRGRPRDAGTAGSTGASPRCGLSRSTETVSTFAPICNVKTFAVLLRTANGP